MSTKLYVGSLPYSVNDGELNQMFSPFGTVVSARIIIDKISGRSKGFGFVEFDNEESATKALQGLNDTEQQGRKIVVSQAHPQQPREGGGRGGPRGGGGGGFGRGGSGGGGGGFNKRGGGGGGRGGNY